MSEAKVVELPENQPEKIEIPKQKLEHLLDRIKAYEANEDKIAGVCINAMRTLGLINKTTSEPIEALKTGEGVAGAIFDALREEISVSDMFFRKKKFDADMEAKFGFFKELMPIFEEYARRKQSA